MVVYLIESVGVNIVKVGVSKNAHKRLAQLQSASPAELRIVETFPGAWKEESELHWKLRSFRLHGEWFRDCETLRQTWREAVDFASRSHQIPNKKPRKRLQPRIHNPHSPTIVTTKPEFDRSLVERLFTQVTGLAYR